MLPTPLALTIMALVAAAAVWHWALEPAEALRWARAMVLLPGLWLAVELYRRLVSRHAVDDTGSDETRQAVRGYFRRASSLVVIVTGVVVAANLWFGLARDYGLAAEADLARLLNLVWSGVLIWAGNAIPKILTPLAMLPAGAAGRQQAARRYLGRALVLGGAVLALTTLWAPLEVVGRTRQWIGIACVISTLLLIVWMNLGPRSRAA